MVGKSRERLREHENSTERKLKGLWEREKGGRKERKRLSFWKKARMGLVEWKNVKRRRILARGLAM
uniref:Uncharacterized protein n=1 Tax=Cucumis melo TaxID=3656 RepID=A0A9I9CHR9_CUCME